jgi:hypothetical protein
MRTLMTLERAYRAEYGSSATLPAAAPSVNRGTIPAPIGHAANA